LSFDTFMVSIIYFEAGTEYIDLWKRIQGFHVTGNNGPVRDGSGVTRVS
jgi:hypothetical protein